MSLPKENKKYTYADYLTWSDDEKCELIDGVPYLLSAPTWQHQAVSGGLFRQLANYLQGKECQAFTAPFDLRLSDAEKSDEESNNVLQPDITVICDRKKLAGTGYFGTPKLIVEITSPSTSRIDRVLKFNKYEVAGVQEYWIVDPIGKYVNVFTLQKNNRYGRPESYTDAEKIEVTVFPDLFIDLTTVFDYS
ncbi:MAG: Uma2 family endonuclease [Tissierellia bacterium]|nr:Uma2 family endonuclease [Tissierellia bacterium]